MSKKVICSYCSMPRIEGVRGDWDCHAATDDDCRLLWIRDRMRRNARSAAPGRWVFRGGKVVVELNGVEHGDVFVPDDEHDIWHLENLAHAAQSSPENVLAVLDRLRDVEDELHVARQQVEFLLKSTDTERADMHAVMEVLRHWTLETDRGGGASVDAMKAIAAALQISGMTPVMYASLMAQGKTPQESITSAAANRAWSAYYATGSWQAAADQLAAEASS